LQAWIISSTCSRIEPGQSTSGKGNNPMGKNYRFALIGCGQAGEDHLEQMLGTPGIEVVAIADIRKEVVERVGRKYGVSQGYTDHRALFRREQLDAVNVVTSGDAHFPIVRDALNSGLHVICEKPLTVEPKDSRALASLAKRKRRLLAVTFTYRFVPDTRKIHEVLSSGRIGTIKELRFISLGGTFEKYPAGTEERTKYDRVYTKVKGMVFDCGIHALDLLRWCAGSPVKRVDARATCHYGYPWPDSCTAILEFANGIKGVYDYGRLPHYYADMPSRAILHFIASGTRGSLVWTLAGRKGPVKRSTVEVFTGRRAEVVTFPIYEKERGLELRQFIASIRKGNLTGYFPSIEEAVYATELADRVVRTGMKNCISS